MREITVNSRVPRSRISAVKDDRKKFLDKPAGKIVEIISNESSKCKYSDYWEALIDRIKAKLFRNAAK